MNHIKPYNESNDINTYYQEIKGSEMPLINGKVKFTQKELSVLQKVFNEYGPLKYSFRLISYYSIIVDKRYPNVPGFFGVTKFPDEWFYVTLLNTYKYTEVGVDNYKCDQLDGLLKFIEDKL